MAAACAGFLYGLTVADGLIRAGYKRVLLIGVEVLSRWVDWNDRNTCVLFGDGAGAAVLTPSPPEEADAGLLAWDLGCDGSAAHLLSQAAGGSRLPTTPETVAAGQHYLRMEGQEVFRRAVRAIVDSAAGTLQQAGAEPDDVALFIPHQANVRIIASAAGRLGIPLDRTFVNIDRYGNTSAASIPLALAEAAEAGRIGPGDLVLLSGFGAGMSWASALLRWQAPAE
jgi:3-oxoacyl-[acyl-carrier-protein] synthase-3